MTERRTIPNMVFSLPHEKFVFRTGNKWQVASPVGDKGAIAFLVDQGATAIEAKLHVKNPEEHTVVHGFDMNPGAAALYQQDGYSYGNLWVPPSLVPAPGAYPHIEQVIEWFVQGDEEGRRWIKHWLAFKVQDPNVLPKVALVLASKQGGGKGFLFSVMSQILGPHNCAKVKQHEIGNHFNSRWVQKLAVLGDEILSNENVKDISQLLKVLIDGSDVERQGKHKDQTEVRNRLMWMFASNDKVSPITLEDSDRRFSVFTNHADVSDDFKQALNSCFEEDRSTPTAAFLAEIAGFAHDLMKIDVDFDFITRPYSNEARRTLMAANRTSQDAFFERVKEETIDPMLETLLMTRPGTGLLHFDKKEWDLGADGVKGEIVYQCYRMFCAETGQMPMKFNKFCAAVKHSTDWKKVRVVTPTGARPYVFVVPRRTEGGSK